MTRKDYIGFCHALAAGIATGHVTEEFVQWLGRDNPSFDRAKFQAYLYKLISQYENSKISTATIEEK